MRLSGTFFLERYSSTVSGFTPARFRIMASAHSPASRERLVRMTRTFLYRMILWISSITMLATVRRNAGPPSAPGCVISLREISFSPSSSRMYSGAGVSPLNRLTMGFTATS